MSFRHTNVVKINCLLKSFHTNVVKINKLCYVMYVSLWLGFNGILGLGLHIEYNFKNHLKSVHTNVGKINKLWLCFIMVRFQWILGLAIPIGLHIERFHYGYGLLWFGFNG